MEMQTKDFAKALNIARIVIERRNTIPILSHVKMSSSNPGRAMLEGTNLDQSLKVEMPIANVVAVTACLPNPEALAKLIRASGGDTATIDINATTAEIRAGELAGTISTLPVDDFPVMVQSFSKTFEAELGASAIDMILRVAGAVSTEETRYYLNGVFFHHVEGWTYRAVATDGHRLYMGTIELPNAEGQQFAGSGKTGGIIIPRMAIDQLVKLRSFAAKDAPLRFEVGDRNNNGAPSLTEPAVAPSIVRFAIDCGGFPAELMTKTIDGTFPNYERVIPPEGGDMPQVVFRRADLRRALSGITAGINEKTRAVKLVFAQDKLIVSAKWIDAGFKGKIAIPAKTRTKVRDFEVGFNGKYLRGLLDAGRGDELVLTTADSSSPGSIVDPTATDFRAILMPMRV